MLSMLGARVPIQHVRLALDELDVVRALSIAVACAVGCTGVVVADTLVAVLRHLDKVEGTIDATRQFGDVDIDSELLVDELKHLVGLLIGAHHVKTAANVGCVTTLGEEVELKIVTVRADSIDVAHIILRDLVEGAILRTGVRI